MGRGSLRPFSETVKEETRSEGVEERKGVLPFLYGSIESPENSIANRMIDKNLTETEVGGEGSKWRPSLGPEEVGDYPLMLLRVARERRSDGSQRRTHASEDRLARVGSSERQLLVLVEQRLLCHVAMLENKHASAAVRQRSFSSSLAIKNERSAGTLQGQDVDRQNSSAPADPSLPCTLASSTSLVLLFLLRLLLLPLEELVPKRVPSIKQPRCQVVARSLKLKKESLAVEVVLVVGHELLVHV
mmetsp:Transcript_42427/g.133644  ORF Transcript_42427/g.133644 Transcript_42427/m.133644 type:complete len:245 (+) Transcript_42427:467-1201(+)